MEKRDKLGIHRHIEDATIEVLSLLIEAAFTPGSAKLPVLEMARIKQSVLQNLVRTEYELKIIVDDTYLRLSKDLVEIAKEINGWISFITQKRVV